MATSTHETLIATMVQQYVAERGLAPLDADLAAAIAEDLIETAEYEGVAVTGLSNFVVNQIIMDGLL